jgi:hypothetical protein
LTRSPGGVYANGVKLFIAFAVGLAVGVPVGLLVASFAPNPEVTASKQKIDELSKALTETVADLKSVDVSEDGEIIAISPRSKPAAAAPIQTADLSKRGLKPSKRQVIDAIKQMYSVQQSGENKAGDTSAVFSIPAADLAIGLDGTTEENCTGITIFSSLNARDAPALGTVGRQIAKSVFTDPKWYNEWIVAAIGKATREHKIVGSHEGINVSVTRFRLTDSDALLISISTPQ